MAKYFTVGIDEVGRGPLAGPVTVAAVLKPKRFVWKNFKDSKKLSPQKRDEFFLKFKNMNYVVSSVNNILIDRIGISAAIRLAVGRCLKKLSKNYPSVPSSGSRDGLRIMDKKVKRIGIPKEYFEEGLDERIKKSIENLIKRLEKNYEVRHVSLPHTKYAVPCYYIIVPAEASSNLARYDGIRYGVQKKSENLLGVYEKSSGVGFGKEPTRRILLGTYVLSAGYYDAYYARAQKVRSLIKKDFENVFKEVDILLTPATPTLPFKFGEKTKDPVSMYLADIYTCPANLAGISALSQPIGWIEEGNKKLPIGLQLMAPHFEEDRLFELGKHIENLVL